MSQASNLPPGVSSPEETAHAWQDLLDKISEEDDIRTARARWYSQPILVAGLKAIQIVIATVSDPAVAVQQISPIVEDAINQACIQCEDCKGFFLPAELPDHYSGKGSVDPCPKLEVDDAPDSG